MIIGFPANNFKDLEPGSKEEIAEFCKKNYGVTFPMADKVSVKGDDIAPLFKWLVDEAAKKVSMTPLPGTLPNSWWMKKEIGLLCFLLRQHQ